MASARGCLFVIEGLDRAGKSTQAKLLAQHLRRTTKAKVQQLKVPDRENMTGKMINKYLVDGLDVDDHAIHLLFSANRWEFRDNVEELLLGGTHVVVDRYAYSGVAYSAAKNVSGMGREWCAAPDSGLIAPDAVIFLEILPKGAEARGGYGQERYEVLELQQLVAKEFKQLEDDRFAVIDGSQTVDEVSQEVYAVAEAVMNKCHSESNPLGTLWEPPAFSVADTLQNSKTI